jgi:hypothetical protein
LEGEDNVEERGGGEEDDEATAMRGGLGKRALIPLKIRIYWEAEHVIRRVR